MAALLRIAAGAGAGRDSTDEAGEETAFRTVLGETGERKRAARGKQQAAGAAPGTDSATHAHLPTSTRNTFFIIATLARLLFGVFGSSPPFLCHSVSCPRTMTYSESCQFAFVTGPRLRPVTSMLRVALFAAFEEAMAALGGRPHWAKDFALAGDAGFAARFPKWREFKALRARLDPGGLFVNEYVRRTLGLGDGDEG